MLAGLLTADGAGIGTLGGYQTGGLPLPGFVPLMGTGRGAGGGVWVVPGAGTVYHVVDGVVVDDGVALIDGVFRDGDILIAVFHTNGVAGIQGDVIDTAVIVVCPVCDGVGLTGGGVVVDVVALVDDLAIVVVDDNLTVIAYNAVVAAVYDGGAGGDAILAARGGVYGGVGDNFKNREI